MIQDPTDQYIQTITAHCDIKGKAVLEVGCGKGRITRDLAKHAGRVVAVDPDVHALDVARAAVAAVNVEFRLMPEGMLDFLPKSFDMVIYTLSLHHVPVHKMNESLRAAAGFLREGGAIVVVEPGEGGSFTEAKERFGAGSGDERPAKEAAVRAMNTVAGLVAGKTVHFQTLFRFADEDDFFASMLPGWRELPDSLVRGVRNFLEAHKTDGGILLDADRRLNVLTSLAGNSSVKIVDSILGA